MKYLTIILLLFSLTISAQKSIEPQFEKEGDLTKAVFFHDNGDIAQTGYFKDNKIINVLEWNNSEKKLIASGQ